MQKNNWIQDYHILQNSPNESGAVCLGIILAYYGRFLSLSELSEKCGVTRNGTTTEKILNAATLEGLKGVWRSHDTEHQKDIDLRNNDNYPLITLNAKNQYYVIISVDDKFAKIYHPAKGEKNLELNDLNVQQILSLKPSNCFVKNEKLPSFWQNNSYLVRPMIPKIAMLIILASASVIPTLIIAACSSQFIDQFLEQKRLSFGMPIIWLALIAVTVGIIIKIMINLLLRRINYVSHRYLADSLYEDLFTQVFCFFENHRSGDIALRLSYAYNISNGAIVGFLTPTLKLWSNTLLVAFSAFISIQLFLITLSTFTTIIYISYLVTKKSESNLLLRQKASSQRTTFALEIIDKIDIFKGTGVEFQVLQSWHQHFSDVVEQNQIIGLRKIIRDTSLNGLIFGSRVMILAIGGLLIIQGEISLGTLLAFIFIENQIADSLYAIPQISNKWQTIHGSIALVTDSQQSQKDSWISSFGRGKRVGKILSDKSLCLSCDNVEYAFDRQDPPYLKNINLTIPQGSQVLLKGIPGSGKTLLLQLLSGLIKPTKGMITVNSSPIQDINNCYWYGHVSFISEKVPLFECSFLENITLFRKKCTRQHAISAAEVAGISVFIESHDNGFDHPLYYASKQLCQSQIAQIAVARALCTLPKILIIDLNLSHISTLDEIRLHNYCRDHSITLISRSERSFHFNSYDQIIELIDGEVTPINHHFLSNSSQQT